MKLQKTLMLFVLLQPLCFYAADDAYRQRIPCVQARMTIADQERIRKALEDKLWGAISYQQTFDSARVACVLFELEKEKVSTDQKKRATL